MDIGTAKPSLAERQRVPHHLVDVANPDQVWGLAVFQRAAHEAIAGIHQRGRLPVLVGGTGQYIRAIIEGWEIPKAAPDLRLRQALEQWAEAIGPFGLHSRLAVLDPQAAASIDPRNLRRTVRALEVILSTGQRFSTQRQRQPAPYEILQIGLARPRTELYARIDARIQAMLEMGFVQEVQALLAHGYPPDLPTLSAIGYWEMIQHLQGKLTLDEAVVMMKRRTRLFVRRQANWFKETDPLIHWFRMEEQTVQKIASLVQSWLTQAKSVPSNT
jgi:tRNA dimethylallyltransferase